MLIAAASRLAFPPLYDELAHLHFASFLARHPLLPTILTYEGAENYEAKGPFFFLLSAVVGSIVGFSLPAMRMLVLGTSLAGLVVWRAILRHINPALPRSLHSGVIALPYYLILSVSFMTDLPTLVLAWLAVYGYLVNLESRHDGYLAVGALAATAMLHVRVDSAYLLVCLIVACAVERCGSPRLWMALVAPLLLRLPLVAAWGGLAAPPAQLRPNPVQLGANPSNVVLTLAVLGFYFLPLALRRELWGRRSLSASLAALPLAAWLRPALDPGDVDRYAGSLRSLLLASGGSTLVATTVFSLLCIVGGRMLMEMCSERVGDGSATRVLRYAAVGGVLMQAARGEVMYERYLLLVTPFVYALAVCRFPVRRSFGWWLGLLICLQLGQLRKNGIL